MSLCLIDTGPLVAYLDLRDAAHETVAASLDRFSGRLATTSAVITESMHFVSDTPDGPRTLVELLEAARLEVFDLCQPPEIREAVTLMEIYSDTPMDFADATLVLLSEGLQIDRIFTLDRRGFSTYRTRQGRAFQQMLDFD
jgi:predicted nucleic acid-binding protein